MVYSKSVRRTLTLSIALLTLLVLGGCGDISKSNFKGVYSLSGDTSELLVYFGDNQRFRVGSGITGNGTYKLDCDWVLTRCKEITLIFEDYKKGDFCRIGLTKIDARKIIFDSRGNEECWNGVLVKLDNQSFYDEFNEPPTFNPKLFDSTDN